MSCCSYYQNAHIGIHIIYYCEIICNTSYFMVAKIMYINQRVSLMWEESF